ncbi:hypothetical protein T01_4766 [Trichinella spiralis]|uniref:Uncharacterized protein n=1 Tax=Trichinella spiralis TaxID=6334 RepID=A0A0V1AQ76_TRISP|nr:hypothetical protein T01_4766 [Trichinella spiralis]
MEHIEYYLTRRSCKVSRMRKNQFKRMCIEKMQCYLMSFEVLRISWQTINDHFLLKVSATLSRCIQERRRGRHEAKLQRNMDEMDPSNEIS